MALRLGKGFSGVAFPTAVTVSHFPKLIVRFIEQGKGLRSAFDRAGFPAIDALGHPVARDDLQEKVKPERERGEARNAA